MRTIGLIAGKGDLPRSIAEEAGRNGLRVVAVALDPVADPESLSAAYIVESVNVGKLGKMIAALKKHGVKEAVFAGKVSKELLYKNRITPDARAIKLLFTLKDRKDDTIMLAITRELEKEGITLLDTAAFCPGLLSKEGVFTKKKPSSAQWKDIEFGFAAAKEMGRLDIGQTVVVKNRAVMAVEAIEGTDKAIERGGKLAVKGAVVVKVAKPRQDPRFDVPAIGKNTIESMAASNASVLAVEAGATIFMDKAASVRMADQAGIIIVGYMPATE